MDEHRLNILLVDDDEDDYIMTRDMLAEAAKLRHKLDWISSYDTAREAIARNEHDVYLFDYRLGEHTGMELLREATANGCKAPIVLLTGQGDHAVDVEAMEAGASDYLVKGKIDASLLERAIRYAIKQKQAEMQIVHLAYYDALTNLPNRTLFQDRMKQALLCGERYKKISALLFLDLDNFKQINDSLGHSVGDLLLQGVASRLMSCIRKVDSATRYNPDEPNETVSRFGGDEFSILLSEITDVSNAAKVAQRIIEAMTKPFTLGKHEVFITTSIGISLYPSDGDTIDALLKNADSAMYHAKNQGRNNYQFYRQALNVDAVEKLSLENNLRRALDKKEFLLYYQPQVEIKTGKIVGVEALIRWQHPDKGIVAPGQFIPMAEANGLIIPIGEWVLRTACMQNKTWQTQGLAPIRIAINMSSQQFMRSDLIKTIIKILEESELEPQYLELEITESIIMKNTEDILAILSELRSMGIRFSIDDFGTGYSSLSYLKRFPLNTLKIALPFVKGLPDNQEDVAIAKTIIAIGHNLNLKVIAEGVETEEQLIFLLENHCDEFQGYYFAPPLSVEKVEKLLLDKGKKA